MSARLLFFPSLLNNFQENQLHHCALGSVFSRTSEEPERRGLPLLQNSRRNTTPTNDPTNFSITLTFPSILLLVIRDPLFPSFHPVKESISNLQNPFHPLK